jgi:hypothetical protein
MRNRKPNSNAMPCQGHSVLESGDTYSNWLLKDLALKAEKWLLPNREYVGLLALGYESSVSIVANLELHSS